jgi:hypothetical protein
MVIAQMVITQLIAMLLDMSLQHLKQDLTLYLNAAETFTCHEADIRSIDKFKAVSNVQ